MNLFALIVFLSCLVSFGMGIHVLILDRHSALNRIFFCLNMSFAIWSLAVVFFITAPDAAACLTWDLVASLGYYSFASFVLHFFLLFTGKTAFLRKWWAYIVLYAPAIVLIAAKATDNTLFLNGYALSPYGWMSDIRTQSSWFLASVIQYIVYCLIGFGLCYRKWRLAQPARERKQARIILLSGLSAFLIGSSLYFTSFLFRIDMPDITVAGLILWSVGIFYGINRYRLLAISPTTAAENILQTIMDSVILVDEQGTMLHANAATVSLAGSGEALAGTPLDRLFPQESKINTAQLLHQLQQGPVRNLEAEFLTGSGHKVPVMISASECRDKDDDVLGFVVVSKDITQLRDMEKRLKHLAHHDALTNLPNRLLLNDRLAQAMARAERKKSYFALALLDLDRFKRINDVLGHNIGDLLLIEIADRLSGTVRQSDTVVRLGGDEFVLLIDDLRRPEHYEKVAQKVLACISEPCQIKSHNISVTASMGISIYPDDGHDMESLMKNADLAMYHAKNHGRNRCELFSTSMSMTAIANVSLEERLSEALQNKELLLFYQPVIDLETGDIIGIEALLRWNHPEQGLIIPAKLMQAAEDSGQIIPIGEWVLETACRQASAWHAAGFRDIQLSVNLSFRQFQQQNLTGMILDVLKQAELEPENLLLEVTESTVMADIDHAIHVINQLHAHGIRFVIDDFGAGYSSLLYLKKLPIYAVKLDRFFTTDIADDPERATIVSAIIAMAHSMKLKVIAEGIENARQFERLRSLDQQIIGSPVCDGVQGYLFSKPVSGGEIDSLLQKQHWKKHMF